MTAPTGDDHRVAEQQGVGDVEPPPLGSGEREEAVSARVEGVDLARGHVAGYQLDRGHVAAAGEKRRERRPDRYLMPTGSFSREPTPGPDRFVVQRGGLHDQRHLVIGVEGVEEGRDRLCDRLARGPRADRVEGEAVTDALEVRRLNAGDAACAMRDDVDGRRASRCEEGLLVERRRHEDGVESCARVDRAVGEPIGFPRRAQHDPASVGLLAPPIMVTRRQVHDDCVVVDRPAHQVVQRSLVVPTLDGLTSVSPSEHRPGQRDTEGVEGPQVADGGVTKAVAG